MSGVTIKIGSLTNKISLSKSNYHFIYSDKNYCTINGNIDNRDQ